MKRVRANANDRAPLVSSLAILLVLSLTLSSCECGTSPTEPVSHGDPTRGAERSPSHGPAGRLAEGVDLTGIADFERVDLALADRAERARSWSGRDALGRSPLVLARSSLGNWLCRLEVHFGVPTEVTASGFRYALRERESGYVLTAFADASGPALGGVLRDDQRPIDLERMTAIIDRFATLMDATVPEDCRLELAEGARVVGVSAGEWFEDAPRE